MECFRSTVECKRGVSATLPCGHAVLWDCGDDEDPRTEAKPCPACFLGAWQKALKAAPEEKVTVESLQEYVSTQLPSCLPAGCAKVEDKAQQEPFLVHRLVDVHRTMLQTECDVLARIVESGDHETSLILASPPSLDAFDSYELAFQRLVSANELQSAFQVSDNILCLLTLNVAGD